MGSGAATAAPLSSYTTSGATITVDGDVVLKVHRAGTDPGDLAARLRIAARLGADGHGVVLAPLGTEPERLGARLRTRWPRVETVPLEPEHAPWAEAGRLLAQLHNEPIGDDERAVQQGAPQRLRRALYALNHSGPVTEIRCAAANLPLEVWMPGAPCRPETLVHGDWHLGQLGRRGPGQPWTLIDVDDLGAGDPAWDLARPAGFWAAGLLPDDDWRVFLDAYRDAGGVAVPQSGDPWPVLEPFARAAVVQAAAAGAVRGEDDEAQAMLVDACARMSAD